MKILVDVEEQRSAVPSQLEAFGVVVEVARLPVADYLVAADVAVERKTVADLHRSLAAGTVWSQLYALRRATPRSYLIVEGANVDVGRVSSRGVRGALLHIADSGICVVRSVDPSDTALWLHLIASREQAKSGQAGPRRRGRRRSVVSPAGVLATVPGVTPSTADRLLARFGSIPGVAAASEQELRAIEGIGAVRAAALKRLLGRVPH